MGTKVDRIMTIAAVGETAYKSGIRCKLVSMGKGDRL